MKIDDTNNCPQDANGDHDFCGDCCCHGSCRNCGAGDPNFPGCARDATDDNN